MNKSRRNILINLAILVGSILISLIIMEKTLGLIQPKELIGRLSPGIHTFTNYEFQEQIRVNRFGLRESGFSPTPHTRNVLLLGDSFVEGTGQSDHETMAWLLNDLFAHGDYQFFNAGISGTNVSDYAKTYKQIISMVDVKFQRVMIFFFLGNDFLDYERIVDAERRRDDLKRSAYGESRYLIKVISSMMPNTLASMRQLRSVLFTPPARIYPTDYSPETHIDWFNENHDYFKRDVLSEKEIEKLKDRFERIPKETRDLIRQGLVNKWCYHVYVTEPLNDFIYNMDSDYNERIFRSTMNQLGHLIDMIDVDVSVILIPDKIQLSEDERQVAKTIIGPDVQDDEFQDMLRVNSRIVDWLSTHYPDVTIYDSTNDLITNGGKDFYYHIDGHMKPAGAKLLVQGVKRSLLEE